MPKRKAHSQRRNDSLSLVDQANVSCSNLLAIAELMERCGHAQTTPELISRAGALVRSEAETLHALVRKLQRRV